MAQRRTIIMWVDIFNSSHISRIGWNSRDKMLHIIFVSGLRYRYYSIPEDIVIGLLNADSHGTYFWQNIRDIYPAKRIAYR